MTDHGTGLTPPPLAPPTLQQRLDALAASGGGTVDLTNQTVPLSAPLRIPSRTRVQGGHFTTTGAYAGPLISIGASSPPMPPTARPPVPAGTYDGTVAGQRYAVATGPWGAPAGVGLPMQFGPYKVGYPTHWRTGGVLTIDFYLATLPASGSLLGVTDEWGEPSPFRLFFVDGGVSLLYATNADDGHHRVTTACTAGRNTIVLDTVNSKAAAWHERKPVKAFIETGWPVDGAKNVVPGATLKPNDGLSPFEIGFDKGDDKFAAVEVTPVTLYGLRIAFGDPVYRWDTQSQTLALNPTAPVNDDAQFFRTDDKTVPRGGLAGMLPLVDSDPYVVRCDCELGQATLQWVAPASPAQVVENVCLDEIEVVGKVQPGILVGQAMDLRLYGVNSQGGSQGLGSFKTGGSWPVTARDCTFSGVDSAVVADDWIADFDGLRVPFCGRYGALIRGGWGDWKVYAWRVSPATVAVFRTLGTDNGQRLSFRLMLDNEDDSTPSRAVFLCENGKQSSGSIDIDASIATVPSGCSVIETVGHAGYARSLLSVVRLIAPNAHSVLRTTGDTSGWSVLGVQTSTAPAAV